MSGQLIFDLPTIKNFNSKDFFVSKSNSDAVKLINLFPNWHNNGIVIYGPKKSGKSHLAHIWKTTANANLYNFENDLDIHSIDTFNNCIFDNFNSLSSDYEKSIFQIYNDIINNKKFILILIEKNEFSIKLDDLRSRIAALNSAKITDPDDPLIHAIILKFFYDNQIKVTPEVINFIIKRIDRNFFNLQIFLSKLNDLSIKHKSKISIPFLNKFFSF